MAATTERCPWCGSVISHSRFLQIQAAIREDERSKLAAAERTLKLRLEKELALQQKKLTAERQAVEAERAKMKRQLELTQAQAEKQRLRDTAEVRRILQKDRDDALLKKEAEFAREREALHKKISEMNRRIGKGTEVAEGAELDLYDELRETFPDDQITRVNGKRKAAGDLLMDIRYRGKSAGKILIDAKRRSAWQHAFVTKLRQDQTEMAADHAILSTTVFPAGRRELFLDSGVLVASPARVTVVVDVLRKALIAMHVARTSDAERADKLDRLFRFITSSGFKRKLAEAEDLTGEALELDVQEKRAHDNLWKKRGVVLSRIRHVLRDIDTEVGTIVEGRGEARDEGGRVDGNVTPIRTPLSRTVH
jgi:hypothetical protein